MELQWHLNRSRMSGFAELARAGQGGHPALFVLVLACEKLSQLDTTPTRASTCTGPAKESDDFQKKPAWDFESSAMVTDVDGTNDLVCLKHYC